MIKTPEPGVYSRVPAAAYHMWDAISNSRLTRFKQSPAHLQAYINEPPKSTVALALGRAAHTAILEPEMFSKEFVVAEQCSAVVQSGKRMGDRCSNSGTVSLTNGTWLCGVHGKGMSNDFENARIVVSEADVACCTGMRQSVLAHSSAKGLLEGVGEVEYSVVWDDEATGVRCKARFDRLSPEVAGGAIVDIKTTQDASASAFERSIFTHGYHRQGAMYLEAARAHGIPVEHYVIIAVEKEPPYAVAAYRLTEGALDAGAEQLRPLLARYAECLASNRWPAYADEVKDIALPDWAWRVIDAEAA